MSSGHGDAHAHDDHADAHDDHHEELPPPEPETPLWFTLLGGALFVTGGLAFLIASGPTEKTPAEKEAAAVKPAAAAPAPKPEAAKPTPGNIPNLQRLLPALPRGGAPPPGAPDPHAGHGH